MINFDEEYQPPIHFSNTEIEIAQSLLQMEPEKAEDRLNFLKENDSLSTFEYMKLWHLVHGGQPMPTSNTSSDDFSIGVKILAWCTVLAIIVLVFLVLGGGIGVCKLAITWQGL